MVRFHWVICLLQLLALCDASSQPWKSYIKSPSSRQIHPKRIHATSKTSIVKTSKNGRYTLSLQPGDQVSLDFGYVGGLLSMQTITNSHGQPHFSLAFSESPAFVRAISDDTGAVATQDYDKALNVTVPQGSHSYSMPKERFRGGFKFLTIHAFEPVTISNIICHLGYSPSQKHPNQYSGHFYTPDDDTLVRAWYAGVFTAQTNIAPPNTSRWLPQVKDGWAYNATLGAEGPMLLDGAKRDRAVWPGDLGIAGPTAYLGLGDVGLEAVFYALETMFMYQNVTDGMMPFAGPTTGSWRRGAKSDTYHAWTLIGCFNYVVFTGDEEWLDSRWGNVSAGVEYIVRGVGDDGLVKQVETNDWARLGGGGYNSALNALNYHVLSVFSQLAFDTATKGNGREEQGERWSAAAKKLKKAYNRVLWDEKTSLFRDNETDTGSLLFPQDGNALALYYNLTESTSQATAVSAALERNWNDIGPVTPELPDTISPFISSIEVLAHYAAGQPHRALKLMRRLWGYMLDSPLMTGETLIEGMSANGSLAYRAQRGYNYDAAYTSLSHSWSTGPTQALTFKAAGLETTSFKKWQFKPQLGDLKTLQTEWTSKSGTYKALIQVSAKKNKRSTFTAEVETPKGTRGYVDVSFCDVVIVNGRRWRSGEMINGGRKLKIQGSGCSCQRLVRK